MPNSTPITPTPKRNGHKTREQHRAVAKALVNGASIKSAMLAAGYSPKTANKGRAKLPAPVFSEMGEHAKPLIDIGRKLTADDQENLARGRLAWNATVGKDDAYNSAKLLGQDRRVNMFVADQVAGLIVLQQSEKMPAPPKVMELPDAPVNRPKRLKP